MYMDMAVAGLNEGQWDRLQHVVNPEYELVPGSVVARVQFEHPVTIEVREVTMPFWRLVQVVAELELAEATERLNALGREFRERTAQAALTPDAPSLPGEVRP